MHKYLKDNILLCNIIRTKTLVSIIKTLSPKANCSEYRSVIAQAIKQTKLYYHDDVEKQCKSLEL